MKTKEEIEQLAKEYSENGKEAGLSNRKYTLEKIAYNQGYTQCQKDMADKKYTEEDLINAFNEGQALNVRGKLIQGKEWFNSLNKQEIVIVFEKSFGEETFGKIEHNKNTDKYQCYETPQYGGDFYKIGKDFDNLIDAKSFLLGINTKENN